MSATTAISLVEAEAFLYMEARLADQHDYDGWEALWTDDATYWVPIDPDCDPQRQMSVIFDNRSRIKTRIAQYKTGKRHSQTPPSSLRRMIANVELIGEEGADALVGANFLVTESRDRGTTFWAGRYEYRLRSVDGELRMACKKVVLVDHDRALNTLAFLI